MIIFRTCIVIFCEASKLLFLYIFRNRFWIYLAFLHKPCPELLVFPENTVERNEPGFLTPIDKRLYLLCVRNNTIFAPMGCRCLFFLFLEEEYPLRWNSGRNTITDFFLSLLSFTFFVFPTFVAPASFPLSFFPMWRPFTQIWGTRYRMWTPFVLLWVHDLFQRTRTRPDIRFPFLFSCSWTGAPGPRTSPLSTSRTST